MGAGWLILAAWAAPGVLLGVMTRGTSPAIGLDIFGAPAAFLLRRRDVA